MTQFILQGSCQERAGKSGQSQKQINLFQKVTGELSRQDRGTCSTATVRKKSDMTHHAVLDPGKSHQDACSFSFLCLQYRSYRQSNKSLLVSPIVSSFSFLLPCTKPDLSYVSSCLGKQWQMLVSANKSTRGLELGMYCSPASSRSEPAMQNHNC